MKNYQQYIKENITLNQVLSTRNVDDIFNYIKNLPIKYKLYNKYIIGEKLFEDGFKTAINNSRLKKFYLNYVKKLNKTTTIINIPNNIDYSVYNKIQDLIIILNEFEGGRNYRDFEDKSKGLLEQPDIYNFLTDLNLIRSVCFQTFNLLLYEDYFGNIFKHNTHDLIKNLVLPKNQEDFKELYNDFYDKESKIRYNLFFADCINIIGLIEKYE